MENNHYPALRTLKIEDGWADIGAYLKIINEENDNCKIFFEHRSDLISDEQLEDCYCWIRELLMLQHSGSNRGECKWNTKK